MQRAYRRQLTPPRDRSHIYLPQADRGDMVAEQLVYLYEHSDGECPAGCPECERLAKVERLLLGRFE